MKSIVVFTLLILATTGFYSCSDEQAADVPEFIFGSFFGFCQGNCAHLYKIDNGKLYPDTEDRLKEPVDQMQFSSNPLKHSEYERAVEFYENLPEALLENEQEVYGIPDAYDQGGFLLALRVDGSYRTWKIDTNVDALPEFLKPYILDLRSFLEELEE